MKRSFLGLALLLGLLGPLAAHGALIEHKTEMAEWYRRQLHPFKEYHVLVIKGANPTAEVDRLLAEPDNYRIVVWQALPEHTRPSDVKRVLDWVSEGGTVWFQDSRLADLFGFKSAPVDGKVLPEQGFKREFKPYGDAKHEGATMFAMVDKSRRVSHPALRGVDAVMVFAIRVGDVEGRGPKDPGLYSAVLDTPDVTPLLRYDPTSDGPLHDRLAAAGRPQGDGYVIFKPLVWEEQYTGGTFQYNLLEWSAGFGVPDPTASAPSGQMPRRRKAASASGHPVAFDDLLDRVTLIDKRTISGTLVTRQFELTSFEPIVSKSTVKLAQVASIDLGAEGGEDVVTFLDGKKLIGSVSFPEDLAIRIPGGSVQKVKKGELLRVTVHEGTAEKKGK
jgi:hypothetical protein